MSDILFEFNLLFNALGTSNFGEVSTEQILQIKSICETTQCSNILEIGFNRGKSCLAWLLFSKGSVTSIDINPDIESIKLLMNIFKDRFSFIHTNSFYIDLIKQLKNKFDLVFIDGDHGYYGILNDTVQSLKLNVKFIVYHDFHNTSHHDDMVKVINLFPNLEVIKEYPSDSGIALIRVNYPLHINIF